MADLEEESLLEIGDTAIWSLSSCKPGYGVSNLRDNSIETYWQSDGPQPHHVNVQFHKKTLVDYIYLYSDYRQDESYTPNNISIKAGSHFHDLTFVTMKEVEEPVGWIKVKLKSPLEQPVKAFLFQISILSNHLNGRDTHIRQVKLYTTKPVSSNYHDTELYTVDFKAYQTIR